MAYLDEGRTDPALPVCCPVCRWADRASRANYFNDDLLRCPNCFAPVVRDRVTFRQVWQVFRSWLGGFLWLSR